MKLQLLLQYTRVLIIHGAGAIQYAPGTGYGTGTRSLQEASETLTGGNGEVEESFETLEWRGEEEQYYIS